jgi:acetyl/propionyl-CoA carboxylase alpha subunit
LPSIGKLEHFDLGQEGRIESGVAKGSEISPFYDPMIAKLVVHAATRDDAIDELQNITEGVEVYPVRTNAAFLSKLLEMAEFRNGNLDTGLIERKGEVLTASHPSQSVSMAAISWRAEQFEAAGFAGDHAISPAGLFGFRLNAARSPARLRMEIDGRASEATLLPIDGGESWDIAIDGETEFDDFDFLPTTHGPDAEVEPDGTILIFDKGQAHSVSFALKRGSGHHHAHDGDIVSPMPGKVIAVEVAQGQAVTKGQKLLTLEAMKMEHTLTAPFNGTVAELSATPGAQVQVEALLARIEPAE